MTQFTEIREFCDDFGLTTEVALGPAETDEGGFELVVDFASGKVEPERIIAEAESEFDLSIYDASASQHDHSLTGDYVLALAT